MDNIRDTLIETVGTLGESIGLNRTVCQMYALLYFSPEPLSPTRIAEVLRVSKGNVSINMRKLEEWNAVKKVWRKGYARSLYTANDNLEEIVLDKIKNGVEKRQRSLQNTLHEIRDKIKKFPAKTAAEKEAAGFWTARITGLERALGKVETLTANFELLKSLLKK